MKPFDYQLKHGDTIEILTNKSAKPKLDWFKFVVTPHAKEKLKLQLNRGDSLVGRLANLLKKR